ncbi:MAG: cyclic pyranopterin monophosphate synthase MoaC, partial [Planctomycetota bacterium]|nr:cyclic pyranopterin monophosphate synthase MoaC [Planctomycetota bacterium]
MELTHFDESGAARMVDVSGKEISVRTATAEGTVTMKAETLQLIRDKQVSKGDVLQIARIAGIMASKKTPELVPLCHPIPLE